MNLGAGLSAATGFFQAQEHAQDRDYLAKQRDYQDKTMQAGLSTLDDNTAAQRAHFKLSAAQSGAGMETMPGRTAQLLQEQETAKKNSAFTESQRATIEGATAAGNRAGAATAENTEAMLPGALKNKRVAQSRSEAEMRDYVFSDMGGMFASGDKAGVISYFNVIAADQGLASSTNGIKAVDVKETATGYKFIDANGADIPEIPLMEIKGSMGRIKSREKKDFMPVRGADNSLNSFDKNTGEFTTFQKGDPNYTARGKNQNTPARLQIIEAYRAAPENKGKSFTEIANMVNTSMGKPRNQAILDLVRSDTQSYDAPEEKVNKWTAVYDSMQESGSGAPSNSADTSTIDTEFDNLYN